MDTDERRKLIKDSPIALRPLDFVHPIDRPECIGLVTEVNANMYQSGFKYQASVSWVGKRDRSLKSSWWSESELVVIDTLPRLLAKTMANGFGQGVEYIDKAFPLNMEF